MRELQGQKYQKAELKSAMLKAEKAHIERIKSMRCGVCSQYGPNDAHHLTEGDRRVSHYAVIPLCRECHQDNHNGIHGNAAMWRVMKKTELLVLAETIGILARDLPRLP